MPRGWWVLFLALGQASCGGSHGPARTDAQPAPTAPPTEPPIGLSLFFRNGAAEPITLYGDAPRYLQEIDISASVETATDEGIKPVINGGELSSLDWTGVAQVEEAWTPGFDGKFTRVRYYRGARWMKESSVFRVQAESATGAPVGTPLVVSAGSDDKQSPDDGGFVRRFVARQTAKGCPSMGDCTGATYVAEGLVQLRDATHPELQARPVPGSAARLRVAWTADHHAREVAVAHAALAGQPWGYGFEVRAEPSSTPANGSKYYAPGEQVSFRVSFLDGEGRRLHPEGSLPSYGDFAAGKIPSGIQYLNVFKIQTVLYYALKHRESNVLAMLSGPVDHLRVPKTVVDPRALFAPQVSFASAPVDGYTAVGATVPPAAVIFGGLSEPGKWATPVSDVVTLTIPADAQPGTYVFAIKGRREWGGEAHNRGGVAEIQVGTATPGAFVARTRCTSCHAQPGVSLDFDRILHGIKDQRTCFGCHSSLAIEIDAALDIRVHTIHDRSGRYPRQMSECGVCHIEPPSGPARGLLSHQSP